MAYSAAVLTISDKGSRGERVDTAGPAIVKMIEQNGFEVVQTDIIPDEFNLITSVLTKAAEEWKVNIVFTVGGTGFSPRDVTPEATAAVCERMAPGIPEAMRQESQKVTSRAMLSRAAAGIRKQTLIVNLPGSEKAAKENLNAILKSLGHGLDMLLQTKSECASQNLSE